MCATLLTANVFNIGADLSGMGDSGRRKKYTAQHFANELIGVCFDAGLGAKPVLVGHSFGGYVVLQAAALWGRNRAIIPPWSQLYRQARL